MPQNVSSWLCHNVDMAISTKPLINLFFFFFFLKKNNKKKKKKINGLVGIVMLAL
jgi:hypothetical protein